MVYTTEIISQNCTGWMSQNVWRVGVEVHFWVGALFLVCRQQLVFAYPFLWAHKEREQALESIVLRILIPLLQGPTRGLPGGSDGKASACNMGDPGLIPGSVRSSGEGNGNPLQYPCQENPMDGGAWWAAVHGFTKSRIPGSPALQSDTTEWFHFHFILPNFKYSHPVLCQQRTI